MYGRFDVQRSMLVVRCFPTFRRVGDRRSNGNGFEFGSLTNHMRHNENGIIPERHILSNDYPAG